jgi:putative transposase
MLEEYKQLRKDSLQKTRDKRKNQECKTFTLKIQKNSLSTNQSIFLNKLFIEAKWFYNHVLNQNDIFSSSVRKHAKAKIKVLDHFEERELNNLSSQMKVGLHERICSSIKTLATLKKKGMQIGKLKFIPEVNSIELKQYDITYKFVENNRKIKIQGFKKPFRINGEQQIPKNCDFANAKLIRKASGYYIQITVFINKEIKQKQKNEVGIDFGIKDNIVTSDGEKFNCKVTESKRLKKLQKIFSKKQKSSKERFKVLKKIKKEYETNTNKKQDIANKIVFHLKSNYKTIYIQDEMISAWHKGLFGRQVQHSALGTIKTKLKNLESTTMIERHHPTTKLCPQCGKINKISLAERIYKCECLYTEDRDIHSAKNILMIGKAKNNPSVEHISKELESKTYTVSEKSETASYDSLKAEECESLAHI